MSLFRIDQVKGVDESQPPAVVLAELCIVLFDTQKKLMQVNNECVELRRELEDIKCKVR